MPFLKYAFPTVCIGVVVLHRERVEMKRTYKKPVLSKRGKLGVNTASIYVSIVSPV